MLPSSYPARYRDYLGEEKTKISNNGQELRMILRGIEFQTTTNFNWTPSTVNPSQLPMFSFPDHHYLGNYTLEFDVPVSVVYQNQLLQAVLQIQWTEKGNPSSFTCELVASLHVMDQIFHSREKKTDEFDTVFKSLLNELPQGMYIKICSFCAFSGENPYGGAGNFCLDCFKKDKEEYLRISSLGPKEPSFNFKQTYNRLKRENVQVIYCCPEFMRRFPAQYEGV